MKKFLSILLALVLVLAMAACGDATTEDTSKENGDGTGSAQASGGATEPAQAQDGFFLTYENVKLMPGNAFDSAALPEASTVLEVPSCAFEGTDNAYNYEAFELTAYSDGNGEFIYSIYILDANQATDEGLYLGDSLTRAEELYGTDYDNIDEVQAIYTKGNTQLILILQDGNIISIEYRLAQ